MPDLTIAHQDGPVAFNLEHGGFAIDDRLTWSASLKAVDPERFHLLLM